MSHHDHDCSEEKHEHHHDHDHHDREARTVAGSYVGDGAASRLIVTGLSTPPKGIAILQVGLAAGFAYAYASGASAGPTGACITPAGNNFNVLDTGTPSPNNVGQSYHWIAWA